MATDVEIKADGAVATLRFVSEGKVNLLSTSTLDALGRQIDALEAEPAIRVWILTGTGRTFLAGADIKELADLGGAEAARRFSRHGHRVLTRLAEAEAVTIAAINGAALGGGCELALACDFRLISGDARIGLVETSLGLIPGWGGTQRLSRLIGPARAKEAVLTAAVLSAEQAREVGLVNEVAPAGGVLAAAAGLVERLLKSGPQAQRLAKQAIQRGLALDLTDALETEAELFGRCFDGTESGEGLAAFVEKRPPRWRGE